MDLEALIRLNRLCFLAGNTLWTVQEQSQRALVRKTPKKPLSSAGRRCVGIDATILFFFVVHELESFKEDLAIIENIRRAFTLHL